jgi:hypothetical protein
MEGTSFSENPTDADFSDSNNKYYEVDYLAQQRMFVDNTSSSYVDAETSTVKSGKWIDITQKFIKEFTANGYCKLTFGSGDSDVDAFKSGFLKAGVTNKHFLSNFLNNTALGVKLKPNHTLFVKYRTGGGSSSNVGANVIKQMGNYTLICNGSRQDFRQNVVKSISVTNPIPAIGGNDGLSVEQIRQLTKYNFSAQERAVSLTDYLVQMYKMPGRYGSPFRANSIELNNKVVISILGIGSDGKLSNTSNSLLKENMAEYMSQYRMVNDYIEIKDGRVINLGFDINVYVENLSENQIVNNVIKIVKDYLNVNNYEMNQDVFLGQMQKQILEASGVINVIDITAYNKVGENYSSNTISQSIKDTSTGEIDLINNTIYSSEDSMFEIKYPEQDIRVYLRKKIV